MASTSGGARLRISIRATVIAFFLLATVVTASVAIGLQYYFSTDMAKEATLSVYEKTATTTRDYLEVIDNRTSAATSLLAQFTQFDSNTRISESSRKLFADTLQRDNQFYSISVGFSNGDLYQLINLDANKNARTQLLASADDKWAAITISTEQGKRLRQIRYLNENLQPRARRQTTTEEDVRKRPWYVNAKAGEVSKTAPYLLQSLQVPGETYSTKVDNRGAVLAIDVTLSSLSDFLQEQDLSEESKIYLYQSTGELIATNQPENSDNLLPAVTPLTLTEEQQKRVDQIPYLMVSNEIDWPPINFAASGQPYGYAIDVLKYVSEMLGIPIRYVNGLSWNELAEMFVNNEIDILQPVFYGNRQFLGNLTDSFLSVPYGVLTTKESEAITQIDQLFGKTVAVPTGWSLGNHLEEQFPKIKVVRVNGVRAMFDAVRNGEVDAAIDTAPILNYTAEQYFIDDVTIHQRLDFGEVEMPTNLHFMINKSRPGLTELFNLALSNLGIVHKQALEDKWLHSSTRDIRQMGVVPYAELIHIAQTESSEELERVMLNGVEHFVYATPFGERNGKQDYFAIVTPTRAVLAPGIDKVQTSVLFTAGTLFLLLPLSWFLASPIVRPIHQLARDSENITQRRYTDITKVRSRISEVNDLANSMDEMSAAIQHHEKAQDELLDAFIKVIAEAIDDKSPHTAGHCARVPELAFMLVKEAEKQQSGPFKEFAFHSKEEWREFEVAAWLHDCGKITTPEHIIDKGTKLETIYNRIHEVRMRFEVLWRDAEIAYLLASREPDADLAALNAEKVAKQQQLKTDFAFIANANVGGEFISDEDVAHLHQLAEITWQRHFDDRLGLSSGEMARLSDEPAALPATEKLLEDRPEHLIERTHSTDFDPKFGIKMVVPEYLYNLGELHNLAISRGTLTAEDRFKINEHIISTIKMLESLPFPEEMKRVPRYASTHHETMKGTGYPRKLTGAELSIPERIMVLADIYEALTAADRPYKKAKPVSVALTILHSMVEGEHIDRDVFELFLRSGAYLRYAEQFLPASQIDEVDINQFLKKHDD